MQRFLWHASDMREDDFNPFFIAALLDMNASLILQDANDVYLCITGLPDVWQWKRTEPPSDEAIFGAKVANLIKEAKTRARESGRTEIIEIELEESRTFEFRMHAFTGRNGSPQLITTIIDRSDERRRQKVLQSLLRDVSHRSKNLLAIIQSIVTQTSHYTDSIEAYVQKLRGRIFSLSRSQDLVTDSGWRGAYARELLEHQVSAYIPSGQSMIVFRGENMLLSPNVTMHLGLAFHELLINAINYGTFLSVGDKITVDCSIHPNAGMREIHVEWREPIRADSRKLALDDGAPVRRLGTAILERVVPASVSGIAEYSLSQTEVRWALRFPADMPRSM